MIDYQKMKSLLFKLDPETAHNVAEFFLKNYQLTSPILNKMAKAYVVNDPMLKQTIFDITFNNPVGLAAGLDKNATMLPSLPALGFGFVEVGTVTPRAQAGNPKPRLFRHIEQESLQNAMGFNNHGMDKIASRVDKAFPFVIPVGVNIGKNKTTETFDTVNDYKLLIKRFANLADFFIVNISSPNTPGLRDLQNEKFITELLETIRALTKRPILIKIAPDLEIEAALNLVEGAINAGADGIIANNTSNDYSLIPGVKEFGGLSGKVIKKKSAEFFEELAANFYGKTTLISVGGIDSAEEAYARIKAGASLVEVYTSFIYQGPDLLKNINTGLLDLLKADGYDNISQAIGANR
jgi:dihydroorotate dehydrogenase